MDYCTVGRSEWGRGEGVLGYSPRTGPPGLFVLDDATLVAGCNTMGGQARLPGTLAADPVNAPLHG